MMELRSVAYNPTFAPGMSGMPGMVQGMQGMPPGMDGMQGMQGMQGMMPGGPGMCPPGGFVNLDPDMDPGFVSMDVNGPMGCTPCHPHMQPQPQPQPYCPMPEEKPMPAPTPEPEVYVVKKGDTIYKIAKCFDTTMQAIILANNLRNPDRIYPGQILFIPGISKPRW